MELGNTENLAQPLTVLRRRCARFEVLNDDGEKASVDRDETALYSLEVSTMRITEGSFHRFRGLFLTSLPLHVLSRKIF